MVLTINLGTFLFALDNTIVADIQASIVDTYGHGTVSKVPWLANAFALAAASCLLPWGKFYATFNTKWLYIISVIIFEAGSALCGGAPSMNALIVGRAIAGFGAIGIYLGVMAIISANTTDKERPTYVGLGGVCWGFASVLGPVLGGAFVASAGGWRWVRSSLFLLMKAFYINLIVGAVTAPVMIFLLPSKNPRPGISIVRRLRQIDWIGAFLVMSSLAFFALALSFGGNQYLWNSGVVIGFFVASGVLAILFCLSQTILPGNTKEKRLFPVHYFLRKDMVLLACATGAGTCAMFAAIYYIPLFFQFTRGDSAIKAAVRLLPLIIMSVVVTVASGAILSMTGYYTPLYILGGVLVVIGYSFLHKITPTTADGPIYGYLVLIGTGTGGFVMQGFAVAQAISPKIETEAAISFVMQGQLLGIIIGLAIAGSLFITRATEGLVALLPGVPIGLVKDAIAGTNAEYLKALSPELQTKALNVIVQSMDRVYILGITAGAVAIVCGIFLSHKKLDMKEATRGPS